MGINNVKVSHKSCHFEKCLKRNLNVKVHVILFTIYI